MTFTKTTNQFGEALYVSDDGRAEIKVSSARPRAYRWNRSARRYVATNRRMKKRPCYYVRLDGKWLDRVPYWRLRDAKDAIDEALHPDIMEDE